MIRHRSRATCGSARDTVHVTVGIRKWCVGRRFTGGNDRIPAVKIHHNLAGKIDLAPCRGISFRDGTGGIGVIQHAEAVGMVMSIKASRDPLFSPTSIFAASIEMAPIPLRPEGTEPRIVGDPGVEISKIVTIPLAHAPTPARVP